MLLYWPDAKYWMYIIFLSSSGGFGIQHACLSYHDMKLRVWILLFWPRSASFEQDIHSHIHVFILLVLILCMAQRSNGWYVYSRGSSLVYHTLLFLHSPGTFTLCSQFRHMLCTNLSILFCRQKPHNGWYIFTSTRRKFTECQAVAWQYREWPKLNVSYYPI